MKKAHSANPSFFLSVFVTIMTFYLVGLYGATFFLDCVCVRACVHACVRACVRACVHACVRACALKIKQTKTNNAKTKQLSSCFIRNRNLCKLYNGNKLTLSPSYKKSTVHRKEYETWTVVHAKDCSIILQIMNYVFHG